MAGLPAGTLMARAARAIAVAAGELIGFSYGARVLLLVGAGDNGADALYAGAELARRGAAVRAVLGSAKASEPALAALRTAGGRVVQLAAAGPADLVLDGLVGIGARGPLREPMLPLVAAAEGRRVLAVDLPSGVDPDTGAVTGPAIRAELTVCLGGLKPGLLVGAGRLRAGEHPADRHRHRRRAGRAGDLPVWRTPTRGSAGRARWMTSTPAAWSGWRPVRRPTRARRCCARVRPGWAGWARCATPATPRSRWCAGTRRCWSPTPSPRPAGCRPGWSGRGWATVRTRCARCARCWPPTCRWWSTRTG